MLPSKHTWQATPDFPNQERDARMIREKAAQEGALAETALRKLAEARKLGIAHKTSTSRFARPQKRQKAQDEAWRAALGALQAEEAEQRQRAEESEDLIFAVPFDTQTSAGTGKEDSGGAVANAGLLVNYERRFWRKGARDDVAAR
jgi:transcription initiation factor TFIID subunit 8